MKSIHKCRPTLLLLTLSVRATYAAAAITTPSSDFTCASFVDPDNEQSDDSNYEKVSPTLMEAASFVRCRAPCTLAVFAPNDLGPFVNCGEVNPVSTAHDYEHRPSSGCWKDGYGCW